MSEKISLDSSVQKYINITDIVRILRADYQPNRAFIIYANQ